MNNVKAGSCSQDEVTFKDKYEYYKEYAEGHLEKLLPEVDERSAVLRKAMWYSVEAGGKRLRPVLLLAACEASGGNPEEALPFACALEYIHTYSLIHDDHPSMDDDDLRRGKPTNHKVFGDDIAILAGDGLLNSAVDVMLASVIAEQDPVIRERKLAAAAELSRAAGTRGMIAGQTTDVIMTGGGRENVKLPEDKEEKAELLRYIHRNKTGALIRAAVRAGALIAGANGHKLEAFTAYSEYLGLVFQIVDDILDVIGDEETTGKKTGRDQELGKLTYPALFGLEASQEYAVEYTARAVKELERVGEDKGFLAKLALDLESRIS